MKPLLLVDVDGVLNCFGSLWSPEYDAERFDIRVAYDRYTIRCRRDLADNLARLAEWFDMHWCTAWEDKAHEFFGEWLGLGERWPHVDWNAGYVGDGTTWKLADVHRLFGAVERPLAWLDDDLHEDAYDWAQEREAVLGVPTLLVTTNPCVGLTTEHVDRLIDFAETAGQTTAEHA